MYSIQQVHKVKNGKIIVHLPPEFTASEVKVIIMPVVEADKSSVKIEEGEEATAVLQRFLTMDTSHFTAEQLQAYKRTVQLLQKGRAPDEPRIAGLFAGLVEIADDFDHPLPDEDLFWGSETDEYGMLLPK